MSHSNAPHSHPICPICQSDLSDRKGLAYFISAANEPPKNDDLMLLYEETARLVHFLGAVAQAGPLAVAQHFDSKTGQNDFTPAWVSDFQWLAKELTGETERRLDLLQHAGRIWENRAERATADRKEG